MRRTWTFHSAAQLLFGPGASAQIGEVAARLNAYRVLVVTDPPLLKAGVLERLHAPLAEGGVAVEIFAQGGPEPTFHQADACIACARAFKPDLVLGLGGGSNMD